MGFNLYDPKRNSIVKLLDIENTNELIIINNFFYHYFTNNEGLKLDKVVKKFWKNLYNRIYWI